MAIALMAGGMDMLGALQYVGTGLSLVAFVFALMSLAYWARLKRRADIIRSAPEKERLEAIATTAEFFRVDVAGLTRMQQQGIALTQIYARTRRDLILAGVSLTVAVSLAVVSTGFILTPKRVGIDEQQELPKATELLTDQLKKLLLEVARNKAVDIAPLRAILVKLGESDVRDEDIIKRFDDKANELLKLRTETPKDQGSALIAGPNVSVNYGLTPGQVQELTNAATAGVVGPLSDRVTALSNQLALNYNAIVSTLRILGQENVPTEQVPDKLVEIALEYKKLQAQRDPAASIFTKIQTWFVSLPTSLESLLIALGLIFVWFALLFALWGIAPRRLVALYERLPDPKALDRAAEGMDKLTAGLSKALHLIGVAALLLLGTSRRALDAWVSDRALETLDQFTRLKVVQDRQIALDLPIKLDGSRLDQPWAALQVLFRSTSVAMLIAGPGGGGKTTLACTIGRRVLGEKGTPPGGFLCLPLLIDRDLEPFETRDGFLPFLAGKLRVMVAVPRLSTNLADALLRSGRVLVIVDGLSERDETTRRAFDPSQPNFPISRLIVTSRDPKCEGMRSLMETLEIPPDALYNFVDRYIDEAITRIEIETQNPYEGQRPSTADILEACGQLKRVLRNNATTPLLSAMWAKEILSSGNAAVARIHGVAELIDSYVEKLLAPAADGNAVSLDKLRNDLVAIAVRELGDQLTPRWLTRAQIIDVLPEWAVGNPEKRINSETRIDMLLKSQILQQDSRNQELMRIALDPIAEHLVARDRVETLAGNIKKWEPFLNRVKKRGQPAGFVDALLQCLEARGYGPTLVVSSMVREKLITNGPAQMRPA